jgi:hypothetical protein
MVSIWTDHFIIPTLQHLDLIRGDRYNCSGPVSEVLAFPSIQQVQYMMHHGVYIHGVRPGATDEMTFLLGVLPEGCR